jgi:hypothetical protein
MQRRTTVKSRRSDELEDPELADAGMTNVVRNLAAGIPRTLAGRVGLLTLLGLVFLLSAALQLARPCTPHPSLDATDLSTYGDSGKTLVVMVFAGAYIVFVASYVGRCDHLCAKLPVQLVCFYSKCL